MREIIQAEDEFKKHHGLKREAVQELAEWIRQHPEYPTPTEEQVIRFLFSCYYDMENAKKCVKHYYEIRLAHPSLFSFRDVLREELHRQLDVVQYGVIPQKDPNGFTVALHRLQVFTPSSYIFPDSCRLLCMLIEALNHREGNMRGLVIVFDMRGVSIMHLFRLQITLLKVFFHFVQEGAPIRLKRIHVVNTLPIASKIMFLIKPFMKKELINNIHFHSDNYEEIQKFVPKECLPSDFGGTQASIEELHEEYKKWMLDLRDPFTEEDEEMRQFVAERTEAKNKK